MKSKNQTVKNFSQMMTDFGEAMSEIFRDPKLKDESSKIVEGIGKSAKRFGARFKDEKVKNKFKKFAQTSKKFGQSISKSFEK